MNESLSALLRDYPAASFIVGVVALVGIVLPSVSKSMREASGLIGAAARKVHEWRERAIAEDQQVTAREIADLRAEIRRIDAALQELRAREEIQHDYIVEVTERLRKIDLWAAENGLELPPPPFPTFTKWLESRAETPPGRDAPGD
ncbi:hypothetical protein OS128_05095 [Corynebacterium sp. P5848]|uniref:hypothetical protein n=1 Tax=Corynebacterium marambiense TaxID=2765364 RepID=UPI002260DE67|nr:hypothetical protein [Corynebacterium marambiense]MCX7542286.1 hypothetical protein [Corynebacterium marambiense]